MADIEALVSAQAGQIDSTNPATEDAPRPEGDNKFQHAISAWRTIDYTNLISNLDNTASEIVTYQRDSTVQRKDLAQKTKEFRKLDDGAKLTEIKGLLKGIHRIWDEHSKSINSTFLQAYTSLSEATDPYPLLGPLETEAKLQTETTARRELESNLEDPSQGGRVHLECCGEEKKGNWEAKEKALEDKVENQERLLNEIKASYEMLRSDVERTSARLAEMEARNEQLRLDLARPRLRPRPRSKGRHETRSRYQAALHRERSRPTQGRKRQSQGKGEEDDDVTERSGEDSSTAKSGSDTLEKLLLARNKKLGDELTILRVSHQDLQSKLQDLQEELSRTNADLERSQNLNEKLENDLADVQSESTNAFHPVPRISPTSSIISGIDPRMGGGEPMGGGSGILPMVTAQRDLSQLRQEIASLQKDNLNLYEKTRYVSTYNRAGPSAASSSAAFGSNPNPSTVPIGGSGTPGMAMDRYQKAYESNISPFAQFRGRESARAYKKMSLPERMVYTITRMVLATRTSRNLFASYCAALHLLVFISMYWLVMTDVDHHYTAMTNKAWRTEPCGATSGPAGGTVPKRRSVAGLSCMAASGNWRGGSAVW
ncbi:CASP protein [Verticillium dahliae]|nr:CASP protein [Verticillium dahliae]